MSYSKEYYEKNREEEYLSYKRDKKIDNILGG